MLLNKISIIVLIFVSILICCNFHDGTVSVINKATQVIDNVDIDVCGQVFKLENIKQGESVSVSYKVTADSHYGISIEFENGKKVQKNIGYITNGLNFNDQITITDTSVEIVANKIEK